ncbi:luciferase-type oxidoreductase [Saccharothrix carnea]|uniref:Luciferase-type oxidoreductase n=1 Tax=Saccharothrix carnea TaxID=1280637 RepID=A0A2P8IHK5_SACCR|nr:LLM class oxidoreductase [Saccharothrix carnea]PSL57917.1 luciferase-type oxidoreductase [Saccharothrix carnea]
MSTAQSPVAGHDGFARMFAPGRLTVGAFFPLESYAGPVPTNDDQVELAQAAERAGLAALWVRDVPLLDPGFGDGGQLYDPWVWLTHIGAHTSAISLATGSVILPLRHPIHLAKSAASIDLISGNRLVLGVATGDRPVEFPAFGRPIEERGELFRESFATLRKLWGSSYAESRGAFGRWAGVDVLPKPALGTIPLLVTGSSRQTMSWIAENSDGWLAYPRLDVDTHLRVVTGWHAAVASAGAGFKPFAQSLYLDLAEDSSLPPRPIHLGFRCGADWLVNYLEVLRQAGVNHVGLNFKFSRRPVADVLAELGEHVRTHFPPHAPAAVPALD